MPTSSAIDLNLEQLRNRIPSPGVKDPILISDGSHACTKNPLNPIPEPALIVTTNTKALTSLRHNNQFQLLLARTRLSIMFQC